MNTQQTIITGIREILTERFGIKPERISLDADFQTDFGFDSIDAVDLLFAVEDRFHKRIPADSLKDIHTVRDLIAKL